MVFNERHIGKTFSLEYPHHGFGAMVKRIGRIEKIVELPHDQRVTLEFSSGHFKDFFRSKMKNVHQVSG